MKEDDYKHFVCIVAGDDPESLLAPYDGNKRVEPYVIYRYDDAAKIKAEHISQYNKILECSVSDEAKKFFLAKIEDLMETSDDDFFDDITYGYDIDGATGDAISDINPDGKWSYYNLGKHFSQPFVTKDGKEVFQARKRDIDWSMVHLHGQEVYLRAWEMVMEGSKPTNDIEEKVFENMKDKVSYFKKFETKENYVTSNTAFWGYAFLSDKCGWIDAREFPDQFVWMSTFYDRFIKNLPDDTLLSIYECKQ